MQERAGPGDAAETLKGLLRGLRAPERGARLGAGQVITDPPAWVRSIRERAAWALQHYRTRPRETWALSYLASEIRAAGGMDPGGPHQQEQLETADRAFRTARALGQVTPLIQS